MHRRAHACSRRAATTLNQKRLGQTIHRELRYSVFVPSELPPIATHCNHRKLRARCRNVAVSCVGVRARVCRAGWPRSAAGFRANPRRERRGRRRK
eukprot:2847116-Pleurochrysis_carterae.AAC.1